MFDNSLPEPDALTTLDDAGLVSAIAGWVAVESAAAARRLAAIAEFTARRMDGAEHEEWIVDDWDAASIEVGAALNVSPGRAGGQMNLGMTLRNRLPKVAALFAAGVLNARTVAMIARRTDLVRDREALDTLDTALAERASDYGPYSDRKLESAIDLWVTAVDPDAVRRARSAARSREFCVGDSHDQDGITAVWGRLLATDAKLLDARLTAMARAVCHADPRTIAQRRADSLGALAAGSDHLVCACGSPSCPIAGTDPRAASVVVHVLAQAETLDAQPDPERHGEQESKTTAQLRNAPLAPTAVIVGGPVLPAPQVAELVKGGAKVRTVQHPGNEPEQRYRPSVKLAEWVRMRDLTCRAPGCDRPAVFSDIDHTVPWPAGPTHPSNNKCYCRFHHLTKTFWNGFDDRQQPDGSIVWTTPTGNSYTTRPFSALLFPAWPTATAPLPEPVKTLETTAPEANPMRGMKMPKRKRTRAREREYRINAERALNAAENIEPSF